MPDKTEDSNKLVKISEGKPGKLPPIDPMAYPEQSITLTEPVREIFPVTMEKDLGMYDFRPQLVEADRSEEASPKDEFAPEPADSWTPEMSLEMSSEENPSEISVSVEKDAGKPN